MGSEGEGFGEWQLPLAPSGAPLYLQRDEHLTHFDNSVNAVSFGFVATAILISMFIVMAIFEKFLRTTSPEASQPRGGRQGLSDVEAQSHVGGLDSKLGSNSPKGFQISIQPKVISVVMPGDSVPKFVANPAPVPLPPKHMFHGLPISRNDYKVLHFADFYLNVVTLCKMFIWADLL